MNQFHHAAVVVFTISSHESITICEKCFKTRCKRVYFLSCIPQHFSLLFRSKSLRLAEDNSPEQAEEEDDFDMETDHTSASKPRKLTRWVRTKKKQQSFGMISWKWILLFGLYVDMNSDDKRFCLCITRLYTCTSFWMVNSIGQCFSLHH